MTQFLITKEGFEKLKLEINDLKNIQRPETIKAIASAREHGDLKENAEYHAAKDRQALMEAQIADLEDKSARAKVIDISSLSGSKVHFGATVKLENIDTEKIVSYKIVSEYEADIDLGLISNTSPVARALLNKEVGDEVEIKTPGGEVSYEIINVDFIS